MWDDAATSSPVPSPERLSERPESLERKELGVCNQGKGGEGREEGKGRLLRLEAACQVVSTGRKRKTLGASAQLAFSFLFSP